MNVDLDEFTPMLNNWFSPEVEYFGQGCAEFADPRGTIEGCAKVSFDQMGRSNIEMTIENLNTEEPLQLGLMQFFSGSKCVGSKGQIAIGIGIDRNPCTKLTVVSPQGIFSATDSLHYMFGNEEGERLTLVPFRSQFAGTDVGKATYWVIPLSNFVSKFVIRHPELDRHPLRIYPTPIIPNDLSESDLRRATLKANAKNRLIIFQFDNQPGFIEPLPDFNERKNQLLSGQQRNAITAVMVGEVGHNSIDFDDLESWFPFDFLNLLSLATGIEVGAPWIEFRAWFILDRKHLYN